MNMIRQLEVGQNIERKVGYRQTDRQTEKVVLLYQILIYANMEEISKFLIAICTSQVVWSFQRRNIS